jgi:predicted nucleic acid-binding protein
VKRVIDASVGFKCAVPEDLSRKALRLRDDFRRGTDELLAPDLFSVEVANSLVMAARAGRIPESDLPIFHADMMGNLPIIHPSMSLLPRAYEISSQSRASVYDALYVALAEREECDLVTADEKLIKALPGFPLVSLGSV